MAVVNLSGVARTRGGTHPRGTDQFPAERCDGDDEAVNFFYDVSQYRGGPVTPSKISMVIICP